MKGRWKKNRKEIYLCRTDAGVPLRRQHIWFRKNCVFSITDFRNLNRFQINLGANLPSFSLPKSVKIGSRINLGRHLFLDFYDESIWAPFWRPSWNPGGLWNRSETDSNAAKDTFRKLPKSCQDPKTILQTPFWLTKSTKFEETWSPEAPDGPNKLARRCQGAAFYNIRGPRPWAHAQEIRWQQHLPGAGPMKINENR